MAPPRNTAIRKHSPAAERSGCNNMKKNNDENLSRNGKLFSRRQSASGYITLVLVVIVGAITAAIVLTALSDGVSSSQTGLSFIQEYKARSFADACAEQALYLIHIGTIGTPGTGTGTLTPDASGTCTYDVSVDAGGNVTIDAEGVSGRATVPVAVTATVSLGAVTITNWH